MPDSPSRKRGPALSPADADAVLARAHRVGGVALSLFHRSAGAEGKSMAGCGGPAAACKYVSRLAWGRQACRRSRERALAISTVLGKPAPFICHMGFACAAQSLTDDSGAEYALAIGPYCPSEAPNSLEADALAGLSALERDPVAELPFALDDIPSASASSVPELLGWTGEWLMGLVEAPVAAPEIGDSTPQPPGRPRRRNTGPYDPYQAADIASALAGGNQDQARSIVKSVMDEGERGKRASLTLKKARAVSMVGAVLEAAARASLDTGPCWQKFEEFERAVREAQSVRDLVLGAMKVLGALKRSAAKHTEDAAFYQQLNKLVARRAAEDLSLAEIAKLMNLHPTAITHRLQRKFGMSFSEYRGRIRIDLAKELLRGTQLKVREVALRVGIRDTANFGKLFRKFERMSPLEYRERHTKKR